EAEKDVGSQVLRLPSLRWAEALSDFGFVPIVGRPGSNFATIFNCRSAYAGARDNTQLLSTILMGRIAQNIEVLRRRTRFSVTENKLLDLLVGWLASYWPAPGHTAAMSLGFLPLRSGTVEYSHGRDRSVQLRLDLVPNFPAVQDPPHLII